MNILRFGRFKFHGRGLHFLSGFNAYVGYLLLEHTHANPVLVTFCQLLIKTINNRQSSEKAESKDLVHNNPCSSKFMFSKIGSLIAINSCVHLILVLRQSKETLIL